jgi:hypothetical protein
MKPLFVQLHNASCQAVWIIPICRTQEPPAFASVESVFMHDAGQRQMRPFASTTDDVSPSIHPHPAARLSLLSDDSQQTIVRERQARGLTVILI